MVTCFCLADADLLLTHFRVLPRFLHSATYPCALWRHRSECVSVGNISLQIIRLFVSTSVWSTCSVEKPQVEVHLQSLSSWVFFLVLNLILFLGWISSSNNILYFSQKGLLVSLWSFWTRRNRHLIIKFLRPPFLQIFIDIDLMSAGI